MPSRSKRKIGKRRVADQIMAGMRELERMMDLGKTPKQMFMVTTVEIPDANTRRIKQLRE